MCVVCGCSGPSPRHQANPQPTPATAPAPAAAARTGMGTGMGTPAPQDLHYGLGEAKVSVPGLSQARTVQIEADILGANNRVAARNRQHFAAHGVTALNLVSSPGAGKTTLLCATIAALRARHPQLATAVIEGDQQTSFDADRIRATGAPAIQVNTGKGCHLDAPMVAAAFARLHHGHDHDHDHSHSDDHSHTHAHAAAPQLLFIENVGNLVCPALWDLGEAAKVAILSVTEGEDKPLKYPDLFAASTLMVLNKIDLLPHVRFDVDRCIALARQVNPSIQVIQVSATTGQGMDDWLHWLEHRVPALAHGHHHGHDHAHGHSHDAPATEAALRQRVAELEAELARLKTKA